MLSRFQRAKAVRLHEAFDLDGDGLATYADIYGSAEKSARVLYPDPEELREYLAGLEAGLRPWWDFLTRMDRDQDGAIGVDEWLHGYEDVFIRDVAGFGGVVEGAAGAWFDTADTNEDGIVSRDEFVGLWTTACHQTPEYSEALFTRFDIDGSGHLSRPEYQAFVRDHFIGDDPDSPAAHILGRFQVPL